MSGEFFISDNIIRNKKFTIFAIQKENMFSKACEYAIKATLYIAQQSGSGKRVSLKEIAEAIDSPEAFTAKILQQIAKSDIVDSLKGPSGGFAIPREKLNKTYLSMIVAAIDGDHIYKSCGLGLKACNENKPCPVHDKFKTIREALRQMLETTSIDKLAEGITDGQTYLRI